MSSSLHRIPPIHALLAFEAAARHGGFSPAAEELCVTPSAVSHRIRQLEATLELQLFERSPSGVRLTSAGGRYLASVREAFEKLAQGGGVVLAERERLRVTVPPTFARQLLMPRLPQFLSLHPEVEITVNVALPLDNSSNESADVEVRWGDGDYANRVSRKLYSDDLVALASPAYVEKLQLSVPEDLTRAELLRAELLPWKPWLEVAGLNWPEPARGSVLNDLGMLLEVAAAGLGVAVCTRRIAAAWVEAGRLSPLFGISTVSPFNYYMVTAPGEHRRASIGEFADWLTATLS